MKKMLSNCYFQCSSHLCYPYFYGMSFFFCSKWLPLTFLFMQECCCWALFAFIYLIKILICLYFLRDSFAGYRILDWQCSFFQFFKDVASVSWHLHCFWHKICCYPYLHSSLMRSFSPVAFKISFSLLVLSNLIMLCLGVFFFMFLVPGVSQAPCFFEFMFLLGLEYF